MIYSHRKYRVKKSSHTRGNVVKSENFNRIKTKFSRYLPSNDFSGIMAAKLPSGKQALGTYIGAILPNILDGIKAASMVLVC